MFDSAKLKVEWAEHHIANFEDFLRSFSQRNSHGFTVAKDLEGGKQRVDINFGENPPPNFALIAADVIHNLRTALDQANWELRGIDGSTQDRYTKLPVADDRLGYEGMCGGIKTPSGDLPDFFKDLEFFKGGIGNLIWSLHSLDVKDKHMFLPIVISSLTVQMPVGKLQPLKINKDTNSTLDICFGNIETFKFQPVIPTLMHLTDAVKQAIGQFERLVRERGAV